MKLQIECTWNKGKKKGTQSIQYNAMPSEIFQISEKILKKIQKIEQTLPFDGPTGLDSLEALAVKHPQSLYIQHSYYQALHFFECFDETERALQTLQRNFPEELLTKCVQAEGYLEKKIYDDFPKIFHGIEVLQGAFPHRETFFFREALYFHTLWGRYFSETANELQAEKHKKFTFLILHTLHLFKKARSNGTV